MQETGRRDDLMTKQDVMDYLKISHQTLHRMMKSGAFPYIKLERKVLFRKADIDAYLEAHIVNPPFKGKK
jgi:excisionase family DNA binding protein